MRHLDLAIHDLVDGRLDDDDRDRALAHLAECDHCRGQAEDLRTVKGALASLGSPAPSMSLMDKLNGIAGPDGPLPMEHDAVPAGMVNVAPWRPADTRPGTRRGAAGPSTGGPSTGGPGWIDRHRRGVRIAASGMVSTGAVMLLLASLGATNGSEQPATVGPAAVVPAVDQYMEEHARSTGRLPFVDPASYLTPRTSTFGGGQ